MKNTRGLYYVIAFLIAGGVGMLAGAYWSYHDEHTGPATTAKVTDCITRGRGKQSSVYCTGTWVVGDHRVVDGDVWNAKRSDEGKTVSVRIHGDRAVIPTLWVSIGLALGGLAIVGVGVWILVIALRRREQPQPT